MKPRVLLLTLGLVGAAALAVFGDRDPGAAASSVVEAVTRSAGAPLTPAAQASPAPASATDILRLRDRPAFVRRTEQNLREHVVLFSAGNWEPPAPAKPVASPAQAATAPPLPYVYVGRKFQEGAWEVYLAAGEELRVVRRQTVLDARYRIDEIRPPVLSLTYLPLNLQQTMNIGSAE